MEMMMGSMVIGLMICCLQKTVNVYKKMHWQAQIDKAELIYIKQCGISIPQELNGHTIIIDEVNITQVGNIISFECNGIKKTLDKNKSFSMKSNNKIIDKQNVTEKQSHEKTEKLNITNKLNETNHKSNITINQLEKKKQLDEEKKRKALERVTQSLKQGK